MVLGSVDRLAEFVREVQRGNLGPYLIRCSEELFNTVERMKDARVDGRALKEWPEFDEALGVFLGLYQRFYRPESLFEGMGLDVFEEAEKAAGVLNEKGVVTEELLLGLAEKIKQSPREQLSKSLHYVPNDVRRLMLGMQQRDNVANSIIKTKMTREHLRFDLENLYAAALDFYKIVLSDVWEKSGFKAYNELAKKKGLEKVGFYDFFRSYPPLFEVPYADLRNDVDHLLFNVRQNYSDEQIAKEERVLFVRALAGVIAAQLHLAGLLKDGAVNVVLSLRKEFEARSCRG